MAEEITATPQKGVRSSVPLDGGPSATEDSRTRTRKKAKELVLVSETTPAGNLMRVWEWMDSEQGDTLPLGNNKDNM